MTETPPKPIWAKQPKESSNAYCWFQEFLNYPTYEIQRFHEHITKNQKEIIKKNGKKVKIPTLKTMYTWSTNHTWRKRNMQGIKVINDMDLLELGEATENVQQKITADIKQESKSDNELLLKVADMKKERKEVADEEK